MELSGWLERNKTPRNAFARAVGVSAGRITQICEGELPSLELAERIARETAGAVTPNDFLGLVPSQQWINNLMSDTQQRIATAVEAFARGEIVVVTDDDDRENEGDLVLAAVHATPEKMAFIIRNTCGIVCTPIPTETAHRLRLAPMVSDNDAPQLKTFAEKHTLQHISVAELIASRQAREKLVERVGEFTVETSIGTLKGYAYVTPFDKVPHMALVHGRVGDGTAMPTRLHRANIITDVFGGAKSVNAALARFKQVGRGVIVVLRDGTAGVPVQALPQEETAAEAARTRQWR